MPEKKTQEAAKSREAEKQLTARVKKACDERLSTDTVFNIIAAYLMQHSRKDTREKFCSMWGIKYADLPAYLQRKGDDIWSMLEKIRALAGLILTMERYEGQDIFKYLLSLAEGKTADYEKELAA